MNTNKKNENTKGKWIGIAISLLLLIPELVIPVAFIAGIGWLVFKAVSKQQNTPKPGASTRYTTRQKSFDQCNQPVFCRHKDKSEHHVRRGKEIDPWDRPDIDIRKYQRRS